MSQEEHAHSDFEGLELNADADLTLAEFVEQRNPVNFAQALGMSDSDEAFEEHDFVLAGIQLTFVDTNSGIQSVQSIEADDYDPSVFEDED